MSNIASDNFGILYNNSNDTRMVKNLWKYSRLRFYILNAKWNYKFWLNCKKIYKPHYYKEDTEDYKMADDGSFKIVSDKNSKVVMRFIGYMYEGQIYLDNPGLQGIDKYTWAVWKKKGLV